MIDEYVEYILKEYPAWKIKSMFKISIDSYIGGNDIKSKIQNYEIFFGIPVEEKIIFDIINKVILNYKITNESVYKLKGFICDYMGICIPSFDIKWNEYKYESITPISIEEFD